MNEKGGNVVVRGGDRAEQGRSDRAREKYEAQEPWGEGAKDNYKASQTRGQR